MEKTDCVTPANAIPVISTLTPTDYVEVCSFHIAEGVTALL